MKIRITVFHKTNRSGQVYNVVNSFFFDEDNDLTIRVPGGEFTILAHEIGSVLVEYIHE